MSTTFLWELEKLRRRMGIQEQELKETVKRLTRKPRGAKPQNDDENLARIRGGASLQELASDRGLSDAAQIKLARKNRRASREQEYWKYIDELCDSFGEQMTENRAKIDRVAEALRGDPTAHAVLMDIADCLVRRVLEGDRVSDSDRDHLERARFHTGRIERPDGPLRRRTLAGQINAVKTVLRELCVTKNT
jgi:hypothetical protein